MHVCAPLSCRGTQIFSDIKPCKADSKSRTLLAWGDMMYILHNSRNVYTGRYYKYESGLLRDFVILQMLLFSDAK